ncbi:hypothetical protein MM239_04850 [Belliella sp. DSM 111904]|uniref:Ricin B lectin domain-containing protein n=1 Tax=Belliella filtrata TaxID=2923435 RepID=A0ABS9UWZ9_9BACT|nr:hypothetical protein [Belliella filtrata]MCH7408712.1 hypothetical protein [Belliella filtrata]
MRLKLIYTNSSWLLFTIIGLVAINFNLIAQNNIYPTSGSVGIGTTAPISNSNYSILDIKGKSVTQGGYIQLSTSNNSGQIRIFCTNDRLLFDLQKEGMYFQHRNASGQQIYRLNQNGSATWNGNASSYTELNSNASGQYLRQYANNGTSQSWLIRGYSSGGVQAIFNDGGIDVNGVVKAKEVKVTLSGWPDYVFSPGYDLMSLNATEEFILKNGHLPNVPSLNQVIQDGVSLGDMSRILLEKIEELTLYLIQKDKELEVMKLKIEVLENLNN